MELVSGVLMPVGVMIPLTFLSPFAESLNSLALHSYPVASFLATLSLSVSKPLEERRTYICCCGWFCSKEGHKGEGEGAVGEGEYEVTWPLTVPAYLRWRGLKLSLSIHGA